MLQLSSGELPAAVAEALSASINSAQPGERCFPLASPAGAPPVPQHPAEEGGTATFRAIRASISIAAYMDRLDQFLACSEESFVAGLVVLDRMLRKDPSTTLDELTVYRLIACAMCVVTKVRDDDIKSNAGRAIVFGLELAELNQLELEFLRRVDWEVEVSAQEFATCVRELHRRSPLTLSHRVTETLADYPSPVPREHERPAEPAKAAAAVVAADQRPPPPPFSLPPRVHSQHYPCATGQPRSAHPSQLQRLQSRRQPAAHWAWASRTGKMPADRHAAAPKQPGSTSHAPLPASASSLMWQRTGRSWRRPLLAAA